MPFVAILLAWIGRVIASVVAIKVFLVFLAVVVLPVILNNVIYDLFDVLVNLPAPSQLDHAGFVVDLTGMTAWLAAQFRIPEVLSIMLSGLGVRAALRFTPLKFILG